MMYGKAKLFKDHEIAQKILTETNPVKMKAYGRKVKHFDAGVWARNREAIVHRALKAKFGQNDELKKQLLETGGTLLAEASPRDRIWGIGMGASNQLALDKSSWKGLNLLGTILTKVREELRGEAKD